MENQGFNIGDVVYEQTDIKRKRPLTVTNWGRKWDNSNPDRMEHCWIDDFDKVKCKWLSAAGLPKAGEFYTQNLVKSTDV